MPPVLTVTKVTVVVLSLLHTTSLAGRVTFAVGFTVIVKVFVGPSHILPPLLKCGVTMIVATTGTVPVFMATNVGISPVPVAARPMVISLFVQVYVVTPPVLTVPKITAVVLSPLHTTSLAGRLTCAVGFTVIVKVFVGPSHILPPLLKCGVTMIVAITGAVPKFIAAKEAMSPVPLANSPMDGVSFVQV